jgi:6,7-dimethyl-8-ribityllumazine synthase
MQARTELPKTDLLELKIAGAMPTELHGQLNAADMTFAVVISRFNDLITKRLLDGAIETVVRHGGDAQRITVAWVPGSFEIPLAAEKLARSGKYSAVICLGAVIQGSTSHHEYINSQVAAGIMNAARETGIPVTFGVITCESMEQALDRAGGKVGNKGHEATLAAIEMVNLLQKIPSAK